MRSFWMFPVRKTGGAYICFSKDCLNKAIRNHGLERSLKVSVPGEVYEKLEKEFETIDKE